jgi:hypothetical protein
VNDHTRRSVSRKIDARIEVRKWLDRGILCVPVGRGMKKPTGGEGWNQLRITKDTIDQHFKSSDNLGGLWGKPSGGVIDVDLDWDEATIIAPYFLPRTYVYGRGERPKTHYLYRCGDAVTKKWLLSKHDGDTVIELRSTGSQSVLPPSLHPDNDQYEVNDDRDFATIDLVMLHKRINLIAGLSLLARHYPTGGGRHDYISAVAGALSRSGLNDSDVLKGCMAVLAAAGDKESDGAQRERTIRNTLKKAKGDEGHTYGWPMLSEHTPALVISKAKSWIEAGQGYSQPMPIEVKAQPKYEAPKNLFNPPGLVGEIMQWCSRSAYVKQPVIDLAAALMCVAMASQNRYIIAKWDTPLQPYMMAMAPTAGGKESALSRVYEFCRKMNRHQFCFQGFQSYHSMLDRLGEPPSIACWLWDEAGRKLKSGGKSAGGQDYQVMTWLLNLYGTAAKHVPGLTARGTNIEPMDFPYLVILAATQPNLLMEAVTDADLSSGVVNRFLMFDAGDEPTSVNVERDATFPSSIEARTKQIIDRAPRSGEFPFHTINFTPSSYRLFRAFEDEAINAAAGATMWGRANQNALILAGILSVGMGGSKPTIDDECALWAIAFVRWSIERWEKRIGGSTARTVTEGNSKTVEQYILNARDYVNNKRLTADKIAMLKKGKMPRSVLTKLCRHLNARDLDGIIMQLKQAEIIAEADENDMTVYAALA